MRLTTQEVGISGRGKGDDRKDIRYNAIIG
jgi:hypothetical protein